MFSKLSVSAGSIFPQTHSFTSPRLDSKCRAIINLRGKFGLVNAELNAGSTLKMKEGDSIDITANAGSTVKMKNLPRKRHRSKPTQIEININSVTIEASATRSRLYITMRMLC